MRHYLPTELRFLPVIHPCSLWKKTVVKTAICKEQNSSSEAAVS